MVDSGNTTTSKSVVIFRVIACRDKAEVKLRESANQNISPPHGLDILFYFIFVLCVQTVFSLSRTHTP